MLIIVVQTVEIISSRCSLSIEIRTKVLVRNFREEKNDVTKYEGAILTTGTKRIKV